MAKTDIDSLIIPEKPKTDKSELAKSLTIKLSDYSDIEFTPEEMKHIRARMTNLKTGATAAIPLLCPGRVKCPFSSTCAFAQIKKEPVMKACLVEVSLINQWREMFVEEYDINPNSLTELFMINDLVECELMLYRINSNLAKPEYAELVNENPVGVDKDGNPITRLEINALFEARDRILTRRSRTIKLMVGDREGKTKAAALLKKTDDKDPSKQASDLRAQMDALQYKAKMLDAKLGKQTEQKDTLSPEDLLEEVDG